MHVRTSRLRALLTAAALFVTAAPLGAQAYAYPSFQAPRITASEYNFGLADAGDSDATSLLFQWRVGRGVSSQLSLDVGVADTPGDAALFVGGQFAQQLARSSATMPLDLLFTVGANIAGGNDVTIFRVPVGLSVGHRFPLEGGLALTPYAHPRIVLANCGDCAVEDDTDIGIEFDIGGDFEFSPQFALRVSAVLGADKFFSDDAFGISLAWKPGRR
jgi:hypothetical protein